MRTLNKVGVSLHTSAWIHTKHAVLVPTDDAVGDLSVRVGVTADCLHSEHLSTHSYVLRQTCRVFTVLKHWWVVIYVQDGDHHLAE